MIAPMSHAPVSLPLLATQRVCSIPANQPIRKSRMTVRRFTILVIVQLLMIVHVVQWLAVGVTLAPIEPSESMETIKHGAVTVGFIFFAVAILSTAILGRWFCGWGCHILMLQDFCGSLLHKSGIRPKAFRSRLLRWIPVALAAYMFVWPLVYRFAIAPILQPDLVPMALSWKLTTTDYWTTFPGLMMAIPFLLVCGFVTVWFLGQKGYCTYACPYGGVFAPVDELAIGRIRVSDACEGCGHCTAVCTSNVRVHEEVALYGMVVDPGCMKCMDCVSVCPKEALSFGFGKPAVGIPQAPTAVKKWDLSWTGEFALLAAALFAFYAVYFPFGESAAKATVPLLFASGIAACFAFMVWKSWHIFLRLPTGFHRISLVRQHRIQPLGFAWIAITLCLSLGLADNFAVNVSGWMAYRSDLIVQLPESQVFSQKPSEVSPAMQSAARDGLKWYGLTRSINSGGLALFAPRNENVLTRIVWLHAVLGEFPQSEALLRQAWNENPQEWMATVLSRVLDAQQKDQQSAEWFRSVVAAHPTWITIVDEQVSRLLQEERLEEAIIIARDVAKSQTGSTFPIRRLSMLLIEHGTTNDVEEGIAIARNSLANDPKNVAISAAIALGQLRLQRPVDAIATLTPAIELAPNEAKLFGLLSEAYRQIGDETQQKIAEDRAELIRSSMPSN